jgi:tetratricopeptide (TPR) repeat protein
VLTNLALAVARLERLDDQPELLRKALASEPHNPKLYLRLGFVLIDLGRVEDAAAALEQALALDPKSHDAINLLGRIAFMRGALDAALTHYRRALELKPDSADLHNSTGHVLHALGRVDEASHAYLNALAFEPNNTRFYLNLADTKTFTKDDRNLLAMQALECDASIPESERMYLYFALGKAFTDLNEHARAFEYLLRGNALKRAQITYDEMSTLTLFERTKTLFTPTLIKKRARHGERSRLPVFIVGMPRSGTSLIEQVLASHPRVFGAGELTSLEDIISKERASRNLLPYPDCIPTLDAASITQIGARYLAEMRRLAPTDATRVTNKMPSNYLFLGLIHMALPNARIIHIVRDPVDTCISCFSKLFALAHNYTYDLAELGRYHRGYQRLMAHWHHALPPGRILDVRYEDVVADLEGQARRIIAHCGLDWDERCLAFHQTVRPVRTASAMQVRRPIYTNSIRRQPAYEPFLGPLLVALGA